MSRSGTIERLSSAAALAGCLVMLYAALDAYFCLGECSSPPTAHEVLVYRCGLAVSVVGVLAAGACAALRRARWAFAWHVSVAIAVASCAVVFSVPHLHLFTPHPAPRNPNYVPCYSGSNDCPGG